MNVFLLPQSAIMLAGNTAISVSVVSLLAIILVRTFVRNPGRQLPRRHAILVACLGVCGAAPCLLLTGNPYSSFKPSRDGFSAKQDDQRVIHTEADAIVNTTPDSMALPEGRLPKPHALDEVSSGDASASSPIALRMGKRGANADSAWNRNLFIRRVGSGGILLWIIGSCVFALRIVRTRWAVGRLMATCRTATDPRTVSSGRVAAARLGIRCQPTVLESDAILVPVAIGFLRPKVVLPADTSDLSSDQLDAILSHEFAHLKRRDHQTNGLQAIVKMMYWWHPFIHLVVSEIEELREQICDDLATHQGTDRHEYAATLIAMAERLALGAPPAGLGMGQPTSSY